MLQELKKDKNKKPELTTKKVEKNLDIEGDFKKYLEIQIDVENVAFLQKASDEYENYLNLLTVETIFDHNMKFKEFAFIFEDMWNHSEPHTERLDRHLLTAE